MSAAFGAQQQQAALNSGLTAGRERVKVAASSIVVVPSLDKL